MKNAGLLLFAFAVSAVVATHDEWVPSEAENEGPGVVGAWKGLLVRAGKKKDRIEIVARGSVGGRGPSDLGVGDALNDTLRASHACVVLHSNAHKHAKNNSSTATAPTAPPVDVGERIQVRDDGEPNGWEWGVVASVSEPSAAGSAAGGGWVPKVAKDGWGGEAFAWHAWRRGPGHQETLSFPRPVHKKADMKTSKSKADKNRKEADADAASANSAKRPRETGGGLPGLPSSGLALVACPLHEALTFANSLPEHTDVAVYLAPMVFHPLRPLPMLSRSLTVQGARAAADANGTLLQLEPSSPVPGEENDEVEVEVRADGSSSSSSSSGTGRKKKETSKEEELSAEAAVPRETEPYPFHDAYQDSSFNPRQPGAAPGGTGFVGPKFRLSSVLHGSWGAAEATASTRFEGDLKDTAVNEDDDRRLLGSGGSNARPSPSGDDGGDGGGGGGGEDGEDSLDDLPQFPGFAGRYGLAKHAGRDKGYLGPLLRVAPGVECTLDSIGFVGGRALLGGAVYVGHDKDLRDLGQAKEERNKRRATPASSSSSSGDESGSEDDGEDGDEDNEVLKRHVIMHAGVRIKNCDFRRNGALFGGAVYVGSGMATSIDDSAFVNNVAYNCGGALYIVEGSASLHAALSAFHRNRDQCSRHTVVNHFAAPKAGTALPPGTTQNGEGGGGGGGEGGDVANGGKGGKGRGEEQDASGAISQGQHLNLDDFFKFKEDHSQKHFMLGQSSDLEEGSKEEDSGEATEGEDEESEAMAQIDGEWRTAVDYLMADQIYGNGAEMRKYDLAANRRRVLEFQSQRPLDYEMALAKDGEKQRELQRVHLRQLQESALAAKKAREEKKAKDAKAKEARAAKKQAKEAKEKAKEAKRAKFKSKSKMLHFDEDDEDAGGDGNGGEYDDTPYEEVGGDDGDYHGLKL